MLLSDILESIAKNTLTTGNPLGVKKKDLCDTYKSYMKTNPPGGKKLLFPGCLYQLAPYIIAARAHMGMIHKHQRLGRLALKIGSRLAGAALRPDQKTIERYNKIVAMIADHLTRAGVEYQLPTKDLYTGVILYDLGLDDDFKQYAQKIADHIASHEVDTIIAIDPHTFHVLRDVYPKYVENFNYKVIHYTQLLTKTNTRPTHNEKPVIHDSCYLARHTGHLPVIRELLDKTYAFTGYLLPRENGRMTGCCGGPVESVYPRLSHKIAQSRAAQLAETGAKKALSFCPICLLNLDQPLRKHGIELLDLAEAIQVD